MNLTTYIERNGLRIPVTVRQYLGKGYRGGYLRHRFAILPMESGRWICFVENESFGLIRGTTPNECIATTVHRISERMKEMGKGREVLAYERSHGIPKGIKIPEDRTTAKNRLDAQSDSGPWPSIRMNGER